MKKHRLISIAWSHYNEKVRWALDHFGLPYDDLRLIPVVHLPVVAICSRGCGSADKVSSRFSTPLLITPEGERISDSAAILAFLSRRFGTPETDLYPEPDCVRWEQDFHDHVGPHARRVAYFYALDNPQILNNLVRRNVGRFQQLLYRTSGPLLAKVIRDSMGLSTEGAERSLAKLQAQFDAVAARLAEGRSYLHAERLTASDISFACMAAPVLLVQPEEGYSSAMPTLHEVPHAMREIATRFRTHPAGAFVMRLFREFRIPALAKRD